MIQIRCIRAGLFALVFSFMLAFGSMAQPDDVPAKSANLNAFIDEGCSFDGYSLNCSRLGFDQQFGCMRIYGASSALSNLSPSLPVVECLYVSDDLQSGDDLSEGIIRGDA